jgi:hypothetical protein
MRRFLGAFRPPQAPMVYPPQSKVTVLLQLVKQKELNSINGFVRRLWAYAQRIRMRVDIYELRQVPDSSRVRVFRLGCTSRYFDINLVRSATSTWVITESAFVNILRPLAVVAPGQRASPQQ